jgi:hypothetical protein
VTLTAVDIPRLRVSPSETLMILELPLSFLRGNERDRLWWVRDACGKASRVRADDQGFRAHRNQFWRLVDAVVDAFGVARVSVEVLPGRQLPFALLGVGWRIESEAVDEQTGVATRTWVITRDTMRHTPLRSEYMWRTSP